MLKPAAETMNQQAAINAPAAIPNEDRRGSSIAAKPAAQITLLEVVEAIDGPILLNQCVNDEHACHFGQECPLQPVWCNAQSELVQRLSETNFGQFTNLHYTPTQQYIQD